MLNPITNHFEVWMVDALNQPYIAATSTRCDHSLLVKLIEGDWRKGHKLLEEIQKKNRKAEDAKNAAKAEQSAEIADKIHWALLKDIGHLGGGTKRSISMYEDK